jgi:hypothetical protein
LFWDVHIERPGTSPEVTAVIRDLTNRRLRYATQLSTAAWRALGGRRGPPRWVIDAFVLQLSPFAANALMAYSTSDAADVSARILWAVLSQAVAGTN